MKQNLQKKEMKRNFNNLKNKITGETIDIEIKHGKKHNINNITNYIFMSNNTDFIIQILKTKIEDM